MVSLMYKFFILTFISSIFTTTFVVILQNNLFYQPFFIEELDNKSVNYMVKYMEKNSKICDDKGDNLIVLIVVTSATSHENLRLAIRKTWGSVVGTNQVEVVFLLGYTYNKSLEASLRIEQYIYRDLIRADFIDTYDNMTLKTIAMLDWASKYCRSAKFLLKTDDDTFVNIYRLMQYLSIIPEKKNAIYGFLLTNPKPCRNKSSKYYLSFEEYEHDQLPDFLSGASYLLPMHLSKKLLARAQMRPLFKLEDVFLSGFVAGDLQIPLKHTSMFYFVQIPKHTNYKIRFLISAHYVDAEQQYELWQIIETKYQNNWIKGRKN